jgi:serine/threonine-protein kinase RsbW
MTKDKPLQVHELHACADPDCLAKVYRLLEDMWAGSPDVSATDRVMFETAVIEIAGNIVQHGVAEGEGPVNCNLTLELYPDRLEANFKDDGRTAAVDIDAATMPDALAEGGRGLALAKAAVDILMYERHNGANHWTLRRTRTAS